MKIAAVVILMCLAFGMANAKPSTTIDCPNGSHWVTPPCYWGSDGYEHCPASYEVCN